MQQYQPPPQQYMQQHGGPPQPPFGFAPPPQPYGQQPPFPGPVPGQPQPPPFPPHNQYAPPQQQHQQPGHPQHASGRDELGPDGSTQAQRSVFIGNLPYDATEQQIREFFESVGPVVALRMKTDKETGRPKGFGFCEYRDAATAQSAIRNLNNTDFRGRAVRVDTSDQTGKDGLNSRLVREQQIALREQQKQAAQAANGGDAGAPADDEEPDRKRMRQQPTYSVGNAAVQPVVTPMHMQKPHTVDSISTIVRSMPRHQLIEILCEMKKFAASNPQGARQLLIDTPAVAQAFLQIQMMFNLIRVEDLQRGTLQPRPVQPPPMQMQPPPQQQQPHAPIHTQSQPAPPVHAPPQTQQSAAHQPIPPAAARAPVNLDTILAKLPPQEQKVLREVMKLSPEQLAKMPPHVQAQIQGVRNQLAGKAGG